MLRDQLGVADLRVFCILLFHLRGDAREKGEETESGGGAGAGFCFQKTRANHRSSPKISEHVRNANGPSGCGVQDVDVHQGPRVTSKSGNAFTKTADLLSFHHSQAESSSVERHNL